MGTITRKPLPATKRKDATKPKGPSQQTDAYWDSVGCKATPLWSRLQQQAEQLKKDEQGFVRRYWDLGEELDSLKEEIKDHNKKKKGEEPRRSFDEEAKLALGSKARVYRVQKIYAFFGEGQKQGGAKASAWPYTLSDLLDVIQEMGQPKINQKRAIMAQIDKGGDFDTLLDSIGKWIETQKAAKAKKREQEKAAVEAARKAAQDKSLKDAIAAQKNGQGSPPDKPKKAEPKKAESAKAEAEQSEPPEDEDEGYDHEQWEEPKADDATDAVCRDLISRFHKDVGQAIAHLIETFWDWDKARDFISDEWERRSPFPKRVEVEV